MKKLEMLIHRAGLICNESASERDRVEMVH